MIRPSAPRPLVTLAEALAARSPATYRWLLGLFRLSEYASAIEPGVVPVDYERLMRETPRPGRAGEGSVS